MAFDHSSSLLGRLTQRVSRRRARSRAGRRAPMRRGVLMEAIESRLLLSTISVSMGRIDIVSGTTTMTFGTTDINNLAAIETFTITDPDPAQALNLTGATPVTITGNNASDFTITAQPDPATVAANGGTTTFTISFLAGGLGDRNATVNIASDASGSPFTFAVQGQGAPAIELSNTPSLAGILINPGNTPTAATFTDFGYTDVNDPNFAVTRTYVIENSGADAVNLTGSPIVTIGGAAAGDYTVSAQPSVTTLNGTEETSFTISFLPQAAGVRDATVSILNDGETSPFTFNIQGTAVTPTLAAAGYSTQISQLAAGTGPASVSGEYLVVNYTGYLLDGTKFDSSLNAGRVPFSFQLGAGNVITGWEKGMLNLKEGGQRVLMIPASEAYGTTGSAGSIPPNANLIFVVQRLQQIEIFDETSGSYIYSNTATATTANHTDFGLSALGASPITYKFDISAPGSPPNITATSGAGFQFLVSGPGAGNFTTSALLSGTNSSGQSYTYFTVTFTPGSVSGLKQATISFPYDTVNASNVTTAWTYSFAVQGSVNTLPVGHIDSATAGSVKGWAVDPDSPASPVTVRIDLDGVTVGTVTANLSRPGLVATYGSADHGFSFTMPVLTPGAHTLKIYAIDLQTGAAQLLLSTPVADQPPVGVVDTITSALVNGWAVDPDSPATSLTVRVDIDGITAGTVTANLSRPGLVAIYGSANHGFSFTMPSLTPGLHTVKVYAIDSENGSAQLLKSAQIADQPPVGHIDAVNSSVVRGWTVDPDSKATSLTVRVDIDGVTAGTVTANLSRPGLVATYGSANHGFSFAMPTITPGPHTVKIYAIDSETGLATLLGSATVTDQPPVAHLDAITSSVARGWTVDPDSPATSLTVRVDIDSVTAGTVTANISRPGLVALYGSANHGFSFTMPTLATGSHTVQVYAIDSETGLATLIGSASIVV